MTWYDELREEYRPKHTRVLFVGESPPDPGDAERRFFYSPKLFSADNLFRGIMAAVYGADSSALAASKRQWLERFRSDGFWLVDLTDAPVNRLSSSERRRAQRQAVPDAVTRIQAADPSLGVVICHAPTFGVLAKPLANAGVGVLHPEPIPFPLGNHRARFVERVRQALVGAGLHPPLR